METNSTEVARLLSAVASKVKVHISQVTEDVWEYIVSEIPDLRGDEAIFAMHRASVNENIATILHMYESNVPSENVGSPPAAVEYARRLAQRGISVSALVRAYRIGHCRFLQWCMRELSQQGPDGEVCAAAAHRMLTMSFRYIDQVSEYVIEVHQTERDRWLRNQTAVRTAQVKALIGREQVDKERADTDLGYRLDQNHVGIILWLPEMTSSDESRIDRLDRLASEIAGQLGCRERPLFIVQDDCLAWAWLPCGTNRAMPLDVIPTVVENRDSSARVAVGDVEHGAAGFRTTYRQALRAQELAMAATPGSRVTVFGAVSPVALLCADIDDTRTWVWNVLGDLAVDDEHCARLRETLLVFLSTGCSYTATANRQILHKNTVQYRVRKAEEAVGSPVAERRTDLEVALLACQHLGASVLRPAHPITPGEVGTPSRPETMT
ncbi:helix-turn-helix domain-containing protein [Streptomyces sp. NPDC004549]|uniref:PucR family transcriptional regulator n=1 Tax=Streptomyces sp. NPDC004549 TaxID=3154283 RepID=UPI0033A400BF